MTGVHGTIPAALPESASHPIGRVKWHIDAAHVVRQPLALLMGLVGLVLLIACANVANLMIARAAGRQKEIAIRLAVGATRGDIVRQILIEGLMLAAAGGVLARVGGMGRARVTRRFCHSLNFTATLSADPDWRILAFTAAVSLACGILFGLAPAMQTTRPDLASTMKEQAGGVISSGAHVVVRKGLGDCPSGALTGAADWRGTLPSQSRQPQANRSRLPRRSPDVVRDSTIAEWLRCRGARLHCSMR